MSSILVVYTEGVPKQSDRVNIRYHLAEKISDFQPTYSEAIYQLIWLRYIQKNLIPGPEDLDISTKIDDVIFVDVLSNRTYESEGQRVIFMEKYGNV